MTKPYDAVVIGGGQAGLAQAADRFGHLHPRCGVGHLPLTRLKGRCQSRPAHLIVTGQFAAGAGASSARVRILAFSKN